MTNITYKTEIYLNVLEVGWGGGGGGGRVSEPLSYITYIQSITISRHKSSFLLEVNNSRTCMQLQPSSYQLDEASKVGPI